MEIIQPCVEKIFINLNAPPAFNLRQKILGDQNTNLQYIVNETKANVTLRGRGSGYIEPNLGTESSELLHFVIEHSSIKNLIEAKNLAKNLLETLQSDLQIFMQTNQVTQSIPIQQPPPIITSNNQITIPSTVLSVPPPNIIQGNAMPTHIIQQSNFIPQAQIIPQQMQIIQQTPINIPPPVPLRTAAPISLQFQGPPGNIQIQPTTGQQIFLNQAPAQQYQLQYIPTANPIATAPQTQTIQHFIQPQQQIQGILQPNGQQFITLQGNTAFMIPPPNIVQPQTIFNSAPPIAINPSDVVDNTKTDLSKVVKQNEQKNQGRTIVANINQPPPPIQQFIVNANPWTPTQQQMPMNSQIQIVTQPQAFRNGNEIVIQNALPTTSQGQQVITTFNPQQGPSLQQIQFTNQPIITQPPPSIQIQQPQPQAQNLEPSISVQQNQSRTIPPPPSSSALSYQQQFEQKINMGENQQRAMKRKIDETEADPKGAGSFPRSGVGAMSKNRPPPPIVGQPQISKMGARSAPTKTGDSMSINKSSGNKSVFNKSGTATSTMTSTSMKVNVSQAETSKPPPMSSIMKNENEFVEVQNFDLANQTFMVRPGNQFYRFNGPQNFIRQQQPPPNMQQQFGNIRPQMMMFQPPPPTSSVPMQQDLNAANFQNMNQMNRFNVPRGGMMMMPGNGNNEMLNNVNFQQQQQQPRFRQQW